MKKTDPIMHQENPLLPCPFCGSDAVMRSCDRLITVGCEECNFAMSFDGLLQMKDNGKPIPYSDGKGGRLPPEKVKCQEYYHKDAHDDAAKFWNRRA